MISGRVEGLRALVPVTFRLPQQPDLTIEFVVDTGFSGFLTLPPPAVAAMGLPYLQDLCANLADDSRVPLPAHSAMILWHGQEREVRVLATGKRPLLGTALLAGSELRAQFADGGGMSIEEL